MYSSMQSTSSTSSYYDFGNYSNSANFLQRVFESTTTTTNSPPANSRTAAEEKAIAANRSHSEAERRRRKRINDHLSTLRSLLPNTVKTDKASLLAEVVRRLRELKAETLDLAEISQQCSIPMLPSESDELRLRYCGEMSETIEATVCCDDRPELVEELRRAVGSVEGKVLRAEMATIGGRTKSVLWVEVPGGGGEGGLGRLRRALKVIVERNDSCLSSTLTEELGGGGGGNKRARRLCGY